VNRESGKNAEDEGERRGVPSTTVHWRRLEGWRMASLIAWIVTISLDCIQPVLPMDLESALDIFHCSVIVH